jgi:hypothetical protein
MEDGGWRMEDGGWRMEDGGWRGHGVASTSTAFMGFHQRFLSFTFSLVLSSPSGF